MLKVGDAGQALNAASSGRLQSISKSEVIQKNMTHGKGNVDADQQYYEEASQASHVESKPNFNVDSEPSTSTHQRSEQRRGQQKLQELRSMFTKALSNFREHKDILNTAENECDDEEEEEDQEYDEEQPDDECFGEEQ